MKGRGLVVYIALLPLGGCASCFGERIADGVARLTVVSAGAVAIAVRVDDVCGFASSNATTTIEGEVGGVGRVVRRVEACHIDLGAGTRLDEDCEGATLDASGVAVVTAEEVTWGTLTGDPTQPVIPRDADAVTMYVDASLTSFTARTSKDPAELRVDGALVFTLGVRLARAAHTGVCAVPTDDVRFESIDLAGAEIRLDSGRGDPIVETSGVEARLSAFVGVHDDGSNRVQGAVTIFGETHRQDSPLVDPFDAMAHTRGHACDEALARPVRFDCESPFAEVAGGVARLSTAMVGALSAEVAARCFSDPSGYDVRYDVEVGRRGVATKTLRAGACVLRLDGPIGTASCGAAPTARGEVRVQGEQTIRGRTTGDPLRPAAPESTTAVAMKLELYPAGPVTFEAGAGAPPLVWTGGGVRAEIRPRMTTNDGGLCVVATPNAGVWVDASELAYTLRADVAFSGRAALDVFAQSGRGASHENTIEGEVRTGGVAYRVDGALDPSYDGACVAPPDDVVCDLDARIAADVARALIAGAGHAAQLLTDGTTCPDPDSPALGDVGVDACDLAGYDGWDLLERDYDRCRFDGEAELFTSCDGVTDWVSGRLDVDGNDFVRARLCVDVEGARDLADFIDAPHPRAPDVSRVVAEGVRLTDFVVGRSDAGGPLFEATIDGTLELDVTPVFGERAGASKRYDVPTPVARIDRARYGPSTITFAVDGLVLKYDVEADLSAEIGWFRGEGNRLAGRVVLDGAPYVIDEPFEADLTVAAQDARYTCDPALAAPLD